ncbi:MAG: hypothetical protein L6R42_005044 [Xanthoria sp. 1 TBL-2021]|nr:MAG: hypothetical protein L6R42_005044 [Xanthoria sp. 1 TBL-2021]
MAIAFIIPTGIGIATIVFLFLRFSRSIYLYLRPSSLSQYHYGEEPRALVTGASNGIGKCLAAELARNSFNVILHGRNPSKLENVVSTLRQQFSQREFRTAVLDASSATHRQISDIVSSFDDIHLTILVNNVAGGQIVQPLTNTSPDQVDFSLNCNARFPTQLTRSLLPRFAASRDRSLILNIGSAANTFAPCASVYGGSKACNQAMSSCLNVETCIQDRNPLHLRRSRHGSRTEHSARIIVHARGEYDGQGEFSPGWMWEGDCGGIFLACRAVGVLGMDTDECDDEHSGADHEGEVGGREEEEMSRG